MIIQISGVNQEHGKDRLSEIYMATFFKVFGFVALWCQVWFWIIVWGAYCQIKRFVLELVSKELNHFGVIADLFRQIGGHSKHFIMSTEFDENLSQWS